MKIRLSQAGYKCALIYGDSSIDKTEVLRQFQFDDSYQVLLSSEVGSEGLDMQFCNTLVNYDLPWNPMVVEQRIGRIDRFGQESPKVNINTIIVSESILEDIYARLLTRIGIFRESIGDLEAILDTPMRTDEGKTITINDAIKNMGRDFYSDKLTPEEADKKRKEIERAIENEKVNLKKIAEGLTNALTNDSYFKSEIEKIYKNNAYVTQHELRNFVLQIIKDYLTTCELCLSDTPNVYVLKIPKSEPNVVKYFLEQYQPTDADSKKLFRKYISEIEDELELRMTFDQDLAFKDKKITFINIYHPIIRAGVKFFESKRNKTQCTFFFQLKKNNMLNEFDKGLYMLAIYKISTSRVMFGKNIVTDSLYPILFDVKNNRIVENHELADKFMGRAQVDGEYASWEESYKLSEDVIADLRYDFKKKIDEYVRSQQKDIQVRIDNSKKLRYQQTIQYYEIREKNYERNIENQEIRRKFAIQKEDDEELRNAENAIRLQRHNLQDLIVRREADLERINRDVHLKVISEIKSLNLVKVV